MTALDQQSSLETSLALFYQGNHPTCALEICSKTAGQELDSETTCNEASEESPCPTNCPFQSSLSVEAGIQPTFLEPEGDDGTLEAVAARLYTKINCLWQTRILELLPGSVGSSLAGNLLVADIITLPGLVLHQEQRLISYQALLYSCGEPVLTRRIWLNGEQLPITENLYYALQILRKQDDRVFLWIDAICIHQSSPLEKSQQVTNMLNIYHKAKQVDIWLGPCGEYTGTAMMFLSSATESLVYHLQTHQRGIEHIIRGIQDIFARPYFQRTWVKQEVYAAKNLVVHCGFHCIQADFVANWKTSLDLLSSSASALSTHHNFNLEDHLRLMQSFRRATTSDLMQRGYLEEKPNPLLLDDEDHSMDMMNVIRRCAGSRCSVVQDHVYARLGMTDLKQKTSDATSAGEQLLKVDYSKSVAEVFTDLARHVIRRDKNLTVLLLSNSVNRGDPIPNLPSWVPDFRCVNETRATLQLLHSTRTEFAPSLVGMPMYFSSGLEGESRSSFNLENTHTGQLSITGHRIGSIKFLSSSRPAESYHVCSPHDWNVFHERHVHREQIPERTRRDAETMSVNISNSDITSISLAIQHILWSRKPTEDGSIFDNHRCFQVNLNRNSDTMGFVLLSRPRLPPLLQQGRLRGDWDHTMFVRPGACASLAHCNYAPAYYRALRSKYKGTVSFSWVVPTDAENGNLIVAGIHSPVPMLIRPIASKHTYKYLGQAMPCQMRTIDLSTSRTLCLIESVFTDQTEDLIEEFVLE